MRVIKTVVVVARFAVVGIAVFLGLLWLDHKRETTLPTPTGHFAVGRTQYVWSDVAHTDPLAPPGTTRTLLTWIWYPATPGEPYQTVNDYLPAPWRTAVERQMGVLLTQFLTRDLSRVRTHGVRDVAVSREYPSYPVVLMRAGLATLTTGYTSLAEDLASHGYVVVGVDAPYRSSVVVFPDGKVITRAPQNNADLVSWSEQEQLANKLVRAWSADMGFALDELEQLNTSDPSGRFLGRLDMQRVGVFGHSLGGATSLQFCHDDSRCKAGRRQHLSLGIPTCGIPFEFGVNLATAGKGDAFHTRLSDDENCLLHHQGLSDHAHDPVTPFASCASLEYRGKSSSSISSSILPPEQISSGASCV